MIVFDFHLHWYPGFRMDALLKRLKECEASELATLWVGIVHSTSRVDCWSLFLEEGSSRAHEGWSVEREDRDRIVFCRKGADRRFVFYPGWQWVTSESLELLTIGDRSTLSEFTPLQDWLPTITNSGGVALLPWGFGKWTGARGKIIEKWKDSLPRGAYFADSYNRPAKTLGWKDIFAGSKGRLDGSDPLPMCDEEAVFFRKGMMWTAPEGEYLETWKNSRQLAQWLTEKGTDLRSWGESPTLTKAIRRQFRLRLKRFSQ